MIRQARERRLAEQPYWHALLHYRRTRSAVASEITSPEFFLAADGATNPEAELAATLAAFFQPAVEPLDGHAQCLFVARLRWLRKVMDWGSHEAPAVRCRQYEAYTMGGRVRSLSLVYATGYLSNPASFFGHILLKFNSPGGSVAYDLLDRSVNFGAAVPQQENPVRYVFKGLFGGYDAVFSHHLFYSFSHAYAENELRDMWEYVLRLSDDEVQQLVAHSWELLGKKFDYYFLKENCAYRMAELLGLVVQEPLLPPLPWSLPSAVFDRIASIERGGAPLVAEIRPIASRQNRFRARFVALSEDEQAAARDVVEDGADPVAASYRKLPETSRVAVADTLLDYYEFRFVADRRDAESARAKQKLLLERATLPPRASPKEDRLLLESSPPHEGPLPFLVRVGAVHNSTAGGGLSLRLRPASYDHLSLDAGRIPHSDLAIFDLKAVVLRDELRLRRFDAIRVENFNAARTPLPGDGGWAWNFHAGAESHDLECSSCTVLKTGGGVGKSAAVADRGLLFAMVDLSFQSRYAGSGTLALQPRAGAVGALIPGWKTYLSVGRQSFMNAERGNETVARWENRFGSSRKWDIRVSYELHTAHEFEAALSLYW